MLLGLQIPAVLIMTAEIILTVALVSMAVNRWRHH